MELYTRFFSVAEDLLIRKKDESSGSEEKNETPDTKKNTGETEKKGNP